jgi:hypothetical protein
VRFFRRNGVALVLTAGLFALVYAVVFRFRTGDSDYIDHMLWALNMTPQSMLSSFYNGSDRLWHICVRLLFGWGVSNTWKAAAIVTAAADAIAYFLVYKTWEQILPEKFPRWAAALLVAAVFLVNGLSVPGGAIYTRLGAVNTWHNPTNIMVRPFAAAVFYMTVRIYNRRRYDGHSLVIDGQAGRSFSFTGGFWAQFRQPVYTWPELILYPVCILFSAYAKPSFLQFFAPTILLFLAYDVIRTKGRLLPFCLKLALAYIPAGLILLTQFTSVFDGGVTVTAAATATATATTAADAAAAAAETTASADGVAIYFIQQSFTGIGEFIRQSALEFVTTVALCAFPLFIFFADWNNSRHDTAFRLSLLGMIVARLESLLLHETGSRASHGNFYWGYYLAVWLFWTVAMGRYLLLWQNTSPRGKVIRYVGLGLFVLHLATGIVYIVHIFQTGVYYY